MSSAAITVEGLGKAYRIGLKDEMPDTLVAAMASWAKMPLRNFRRLSRLNTFRDNGNSDDTVWALRDVSFEVREGEVVGVIGRNGAGKSTLLKILSRITEPTTGRAVIHGRVSSLLEVGTGFHPELSGRENIYMNGTILGMTKREIDRKFDEIVDFSGVEKFLDTAIKRYSSGMKVRLAFSVAAHLEPEILVIDEVLAVGDAEFQRKCLGKMQDVASHGRTVLFVSHNMASVEALCSRAVLLEGGRTSLIGETAAVVDHYHHSRLDAGCEEDRGEVDLLSLERRSSEGQPILRQLRLLRKDGRASNTFKAGGPVRLEVDLTDAYQQPGLCVAVFVCDYAGRRLAMFHSRVNSQLALSDPKGACVRCEVPSLPLIPGKYYLDVSCGAQSGVADYVERAAVMHIVPADFFGTGELPVPNQASILLRAHWSVVEPSPAAELSESLL